MALSPPRIHRGRPTPFAWEREALDHLYKDISDNDPHQAWELYELYEPGSGRIYEVDLVFLSWVGLIVVEIKSHPGALRGDMVDWTFTDDTGHKRVIECPFAGVNLKARVLASMLERQLPGARPWVHAAVYVPKATSVQLEGGTPPWLLQKGDAVKRLVNGFDERPPKVIVNRPVMKSVLQSAERVGLRPSRTARLVGGYTLGALLDDGEGYQEHEAKSASVQSDLARVRSFLVPAATSTERRAQLQRAARREANALSQLGQHPGILGYRTFVEDAPLGPALVFEAFEGGLPLHTFLKQHPELTFDERLNLLQQIVEAVAHCHRAGVLHRNLSPASVLVGKDAGGRWTVRLHRFQTAAWVEHSSFGTLHINDFVRDLDRLYEAPEVLADPKKASFESDIFSVGCLAWLLFTGQHPAATLAEREQRIKGPDDSHGGLRPSSVRGELAQLDDAFIWATHPNLHARGDDISEWFNVMVLEAVTRPAPSATTELDPTEAQKGAELPGRLKVERRLGKGGTALVLHVRREGKDYALKVPHDEGCGERLASEARVLKGLRHEHIVGFHETVTIKKLPCLLLEFAGEQTLGDLLRAQGTLPLELARRYGDDLLSAVQYLEEHGVTHRDIKPGNIGFTNLSKKMQHLLLLDFSLSGADPKSVSAGTAEWRDPWLYLRGSWDAAADRWSAAAVLYQVVTGARPQVSDGGKRPGEVHIEAERFDSAVRDRLAAFFRKSLAKDSAARFTSAETMKQAWVEALAPGGDDEVPLEPMDVSQVRPDTPVDALPLSVRARNALDRAGVHTVADLLQLPRNQLSVIRGVGTKVARDIVAIADTLRTSVSVEAAGPALVPGFVRPRLPLDDADLKLEAVAVEALEEAGLSSTLDLAQAPEARVRHLVGDTAAATLRAKLQELAAAEPTPGSLGDWVKELIGRAAETEANRRLRLLVGLDAFPDGRPDEGPPAARAVPEVAGSLGVDLAQIHSSLQFLRNKRWAGHATARALVETLSSLLDVHGPAVTLDDLAAALAAAQTGGPASDDDRRLAAALVRVALELRPDPFAQWRRIGSTAWIARDPAVLDAVAALGAAADRLAAMEPLPSSETVRAELATVVKETPLADLAADRRVTLAAKASEGAAASARMELYPRGLDAARAIKLSLGALTGDGLNVETVRSRISGRYPEAVALPQRPALDLLLAVHDLRFNPDTGMYARPGENVPTSQTVVAPRPPTSAPPPLVARASPDEQRADAFQEQLDRGVRSRRFRVVQVRADLAPPATELLSRVLRTEVVSFDHAFVAAVRSMAQELEVEWQNVEEADRAGPEGPSWAMLRELVARATDALIDRLLEPREGPVLIAWPGALNRYGLAGALSRLAERAQHGEGTPGVILIVPSFLDGLPPMINGRLPVPAPLPEQRLVMPDAWFARHTPREAR
jgi:serine/threonine protein kinase